MRRFLRTVACLLTGFSLAFTQFLYPAAAQQPRVNLESIRVYPTPEGATIEIQTDSPCSFVTYTLKDPDRLVVDLAESEVESLIPESGTSPANLVRDWHLFWDAKDGELGWVDYISFQLAAPAEHLVESVPGKLLIRVRSQEGEEGLAGYAAAEYIDSLLKGRQLMSPVSAEYPASQIPEAFPLLAVLNPSGYPSPDAAPTSSGNSGVVWSVDKSLQFGLSRYRAIQVAEEETKLAHMKVREARRALYPAATFKSTWTDGTASRVDFTEVNHGLQLDQPLYSAGRLSETYRQALVNLQIAEKRKRKAESDFSLEIVQAYYQLVGAEATLEIQTQVMPKIQDTLRRTRKRYEKGLLTKLEMLNVESQFNQAAFQKATAENDYTLAHLKFLQRMKLNENAIVEVPSQFPAYSPQEISLEEAFQLAMKYRPDIHINTLLLQFNEYEEQIAKAKGGLRVDLTTFLGFSGSAFETETISLDKDYSFGIKATRNWGPHEAAFSSTTTKTSPRLGQTSRTDSTVRQLELGILKSLNGLSEIQQALVSVERAKQDLDDTKASVLQEVEEAYISYSKARIQLQYVKEKVNFRREQLKIFEAQAALNEALPSQILQGIIQLNDEYISESVALTNYYVALARLNKAVGMPGHYK